MYNVKFVTIISTTLLIFGTILANIDEDIYFADKNLEKAICVELNINPPVTEAAILNLRSIKTGSVDHAGQISDLKGIEYALNLKSFSLDRHDINDISPLSELKNLQELVLVWGELKDISPLKNLTNLSVLHLQGNQIEDISAISEFSKFKELSLQVNPLNEEAYSIYIPKIKENNPSVILYHDRTLHPAKALRLVQIWFWPVIGLIGLLFFLIFKYTFRTKKRSK